MLKRINNILPELLLEIFIYGLIVQLAGVWFVEDKLGYSIGLWLGIALAMGMAIHMAVTIADSLEGAVGGRITVRTTLFFLLRYLVVVLLFVAVFYFDLGNVILMFIGVMGLKVAAYLQPLMHRFLAGKGSPAGKNGLAGEESLAGKDSLTGKGSEKENESAES